MQGAWRGKYLVASGRGPYPHTDPEVEVRRIFHRLPHSSIENFYEHFKTIFEWPPSGANLRPIRHRALRAGAVFVYHLALLRRHEWNLDSNGGLKAFLRAA